MRTDGVQMSSCQSSSINHTDTLGSSAVHYQTLCVTTQPGSSVGNTDQNQMPLLAQTHYLIPSFPLSRMETHSLTHLQ